MTFTVRHTSVDEVAYLAADLMCDCDIYDEDEGTVVVTMRDEFCQIFFRALNRWGFVWHTGRPRGAYSDPTFARAAQRVELPAHSVAHGEVR